MNFNNVEELWQYICKKNPLLLTESKSFSIKVNNFYKALKLAYDEGYKQGYKQGQNYKSQSSSNNKEFDFLDMLDKLNVKK